MVGLCVVYTCTCMTFVNDPRTVPPLVTYVPLHVRHRDELRVTGPQCYLKFTLHIHVSMYMYLHMYRWFGHVCI